jgi:phenylacetate-coenzyme A ligase PaaK-like adenylate-forming protein
MTDFETFRGRHAEQYQALLPEHLARLSWSADEVRAERERRLRSMIAVAKERSPGHRERLAHLDAERVTEADLASIPPMTKDDLMRNFDGIVTDRRLSRASVEAHLDRSEGNPYLLDEYRVVASGGSSGTRGVFVYDWNGWLLFFLAFSRLRVRAQLADALVGAQPVWVVIGGGKPSHMSFAMPQTFGVRGAVTSLAATLPLADIVARLNELQPVMLTGYPSPMPALAHAAASGRLAISPRLISVVSEPFLPEMRAAIEAAWTWPIFNIYATSEGATAASCGQGRGMHVNEDLCIFEPIDADGRPVRAGQRAAKLYITPLFNHAQPLIRYELTDEVTVIDEPCPCGSNFRRIDDIEGRADDMFVYRDGVSVHPLVFRSVLGQQRNVIEYQVRQTERGAAIALRVDGEVGTATIRDAIARELTRLGLPEPEVSVELVSGFDRQQTGKLKRFFPLPPSA